MGDVPRLTPIRANSIQELSEKLDVINAHVAQTNRRKSQKIRELSEVISLLLETATQGYDIDLADVLVESPLREVIPEVIKRLEPNPENNHICLSTIDYCRDLQVPHRNVRRVAEDYLPAGEYKNPHTGEMAVKPEYGSTTIKRTMAEWLRHYPISKIAEWRVDKTE